jgi:AbrB family looped-hinge helix DNA binding protein
VDQPHGCGLAHRLAFATSRIVFPSAKDVPIIVNRDIYCRFGAAMAVQVNITRNGRMSLPADVRRRLGLAKVGTVFVEETDDGLVLRTAAQAVARAQALAWRFTDGKADASVSAFIANRRAASGA